jgi:phosphatidylglycerol:prolipoprotein diacylglycerol transferase
MNGTLIHIAFDAIAWLGAGLSLLWLTKSTRVRFPAAPTGDLAYIAALVFGAGVGAVLFGSANLWLAHLPGVARSIEGAIFGGIAAVELYKRMAGVTVRTGARFALPLAVGVAVGRIGCFFSGLDDFTHGTPTTLPWGHDFGDGIARHPVQLYESAAMALFLAAYLIGLKRRSPWAIRRGFYAMCIVYGVQRFAWEFLKPYPPVLGPLNIFHVLCGGLAIYGWVYWRGDVQRERGAKERALSVPGPDHQPV